MGATTRSPMDVDCYKAGYDTTSRRHKSVGGPSRVSGRQRRRCLGGRQGGRKRVYSVFLNGDDWHGLNWVPSIVSPLSKIKVRVPPENEKVDSHFRNGHFALSDIGNIIGR